jgi:crotonobetainyl-CoA:carnitine CoA-transferase CaiB-like acyl-CoA transferase
LALVDVLTAKDAVIGVLAALLSRGTSGRGQHVRVNLLSSLLGSLANQASSFLATGCSPRRMGNRHPSIAPYETLHCRDGLIAVACGNDRQFQRLVSILGIPAVATDERFSTNAARVTNRDALVSALERELSKRDAAYWEELLVAGDIPAGRVADIEAAFDRARHLDLAPTVPVGAGHPDQVAHPIRYSQMTPRVPTAPPRCGEHHTLVHRWLSGHDRSLDGLAR